MRAASWQQEFAEPLATTLQLDAQGRIRGLNASGRKVLGDPGGARVGTSWFDLLPRHLAPRAREELSPWLAGSAGPVAVFQCPLNGPDGNALRMAWTLVAEQGGGATLHGTPLPADADPTDWLPPAPLHVALADRTRADELQLNAMEGTAARRRAEEKAQRLSDELSRAGKDLEQLAYATSRDLQEPLRSVRSFAGLLARQCKGKLDRDADEFIGHILEGVTRLQSVANGLQAWARVEAQGNTFTATECDALLKRVLADLQPAIQEAKATVTVDPLPRIRGDGMQLAQVFSNLISNALKFRRQTAPEVRVTVTEDGPRWLFSVRDNGIGIPPDSAEQLFRPFQRLHSPAEYPGNGLGLATCKRIIERHGGRIWVEHVPSGGSDFRFHLPRT